MIAPRLKNYFSFDFLRVVILSPLSTKLLRLLRFLSSLLSSSPATGYSLKLPSTPSWCCFPIIISLIVLYSEQLYLLFTCTFLFLFVPSCCLLVCLVVLRRTVLYNIVALLEQWVKKWPSHLSPFVDHFSSVANQKAANYCPYHQRNGHPLE